MACPTGCHPHRHGSHRRLLEASVAYLSDGEFQLVLANAAHVKNVPGRKTDVKDAEWLADLIAHGLIRPSIVPDEPTQQMLDLLRTRKQLVGSAPATSCAFRRRWKTPTSSWIRSSATFWDYRVVASSKH
jgi:hypothetical protein